jgi:replicative DNA helicase
MPSSSGRPEALPYSEEAEKAVLGSILIDPEQNFPKISSILKSRDFYLEKHRIIYTCLLEMQACGIPIDMLTLCESLRSNADEERIGGAAFIANLTEYIGVNVDHYAQMVKKKADERRLLFALQNT